MVRKRDAASSFEESPWPASGNEMAVGVAPKVLCPVTVRDGSDGRTAGNNARVLEVLEDSESGRRRR